jgi:dTDP-4-amino-4,6-dideoxygalactose transaminase
MREIEYEHLGQLNAPLFEEVEKAFSRVLHSGWYILGQEVKAFEQAFATYCNAMFCSGVANGLDALTISLKALQLPPGSEVIVPSNTYIATILAVVQAGCVPVLVEPDIRTYNIDPKKIEERINSHTRAIIVVHLYGKCCEMPAIKSIAEQHQLFIVEDCAQAHGASINGQRAGTFGDLGAFSFYPTKNLGALGDGGAITTDNPLLYASVNSLRNYGSSKKYHNDVVGYNSRLDEMQAAFLSVKLMRLDQINDHKRKLADIYSKNLKTDFILPVQQEGYHDVFHIYNVRHPKRDALKSFLLQAGIKTEIHYPISPVKQVAMAEIFKGIETPIANEIHATTLSLPISYIHSSDDIARVVETMNKF